MNVLGIDVGASAVKHAVYDSDGQTLAAGQEAAARSYAALKEQLQAIIAASRAALAPAAAGIGVPGFISLPERVIERSPNMRFLDGMSLERDLAATGLPLAVENDANAAAFGEFAAAAAENPNAPDAGLVLLTLGSGVGSGIVLHGRLLRGAGGFAGELGHLLVNSQGRACGCGNRGCAESECSAAGLVCSYQELSGSEAALSAREVFARRQAGDEAARLAFERAGTYLGVLLAQIVYALNPGRIAIGGGMAAAGEALLAPARSELARRVVPRALASTVIAPARLGNDAGRFGAAAIARRLPCRS